MAFFKWIQAILQVVEVIGRNHSFTDPEDPESATADQLEGLLKVCRGCLSKCEQILPSVVEMNGEEAGRLEAATGETGGLVGLAQGTEAIRSTAHTPQHQPSTRQLIRPFSRPPRWGPEPDRHEIPQDLIPLIPLSRLTVAQMQAMLHLQLIHQRAVNLRSFSPKQKANALFLTALAEMLDGLEEWTRKKCQIDADIREALQICITDLKAKDVAAQITWISSWLFQQISIDELSNPTGFHGPKRREVAPGVAGSVDFFNYLSSWVASECLLPATAKDRCTAMIQWVKIGEELLTASSFDSLKAVVAALNSTAVVGARETLQLLPPKMVNNLRQLTLVCTDNRNYAQFRHLHAKAKLPAIPFLGLITRDLVYMDPKSFPSNEDGANATINSPTSVASTNSSQRRATETFQGITRFQSVPYLEHIQPDGIIQHWILSRVYRTQDELYELRKMREPPQGDSSKRSVSPTRQADEASRWQSDAVSSEKSARDLEMAGSILPPSPANNVGYDMLFQRIQESRT